jgi:predicted enzyme related to lactoylglutathione lyase
VGSSDLERSHAFYAGVLGHGLTESSDFANEYDARGTPLRVTRVPAVEPAPYTVLGWRVTDVLTAPGGGRVAWFEDPDGNVISLQQPPPRPRAG